MLFNGPILNGATFNGSSSTGLPDVEDWTLSAPLERQSVYFLDIGNLRVPFSVAQATMRKTGQSFLQVTVPGGGQYVDELTALANEPMILRSGYKYADGSLSPLEPIAEVPFEQLRRDEGSSSDTLTLSGYGERPTLTSTTRVLANVRYRSTDALGKRRTRCDIDLFLRPGHGAEDSDGIVFPVGIIQYFIGTRSENMEVIQDG